MKLGSRNPLLLARQGVLQKSSPAGREDISREFRDAAGRWHGLACRARVIVYNTEKLAEKGRKISDSKKGGEATVVATITPAVEPTVQPVAEPIAA